eukprot:EG_transcript_9025
MPGTPLYCRVPGPKISIIDGIEVADVPSDWSSALDQCLADAFMFGGLDDILPSGLPALLESGPELRGEDRQPPSPTSSSDSESSSQGLSKSSSTTSAPGFCARVACQQPTAAAWPTEGDAAERPRERPQGKFPLCPNGRCNHREDWSRVRVKRAFSFFVCNYCGLGWCTPKLAKPLTAEPLPVPAV